ncbi:MAG TPA: VanZ family protein [Phycisphaerae bacterium]|nr:VanZ family protein [Phycisphaerae bacterium]
MKWTAVTRRRVLRIIFVAYWVTLFGLTHLSKLPACPGPHYKDKFAHVAGYALLTGLALAAWHAGGRSAARSALVWFAVLSSYAAVDELLQTLVGRSCTLGDWLADMTGVALAVAISLIRAGKPPSATDVAQS